MRISLKNFKDKDIVKSNNFVQVECVVKLDDSMPNNMFNFTVLKNKVTAIYVTDCSGIKFNSKRIHSDVKFLLENNEKNALIFGTVGKVFNDEFELFNPSFNF